MTIEEIIELTYSELLERINDLEDKISGIDSLKNDLENDIESLNNIILNYENNYIKLYLIQGSNSKCLCIADDSNTAKDLALRLGINSPSILEELNDNSLIKSFKIE